MKIKRFKEVIEDAPVNATGVAVATNEPIVRKKKKKQDSEYREIGTPELLKRYKEDTPGQENAITESEKLVTFEIMDGAPVKDELVPIRFYLASTDLTPTYKNVNNRYAVKYMLNLVLIDEEDRRYFK